MKIIKKFNVDVYSKKSNDYSVTKCLFVCEMSNAKHKKLKEFANGSTYWFSGLSGTNWTDGGHYNYGTLGFINASLYLNENVQGVVYGNEVYLLRSIETVI